MPTKRYCENYSAFLLNACEQVILSGSCGAVGIAGITNVDDDMKLFLEPVEEQA